MLTYRTGAAGSPSAAKAMADHLREQTLPTSKADLARYYQQGLPPDPAGEQQSLAFGEGVRGHTAAEPRRDMHPGLAALLALDPNRVPTRDEIANLLNGQRADGNDILGKQKQRATASLKQALGLDPDRLPARTDIDHIVAGRRADGKPIAGAGTETARGRFFHLLGLKASDPDAIQLGHLLSGRMADGTPVDPRAYADGINASKTRIGYVDLTFSADKSLSIAWALAPTEAERNMLAQAHRDAVASAMAYIASEIGHVTKGKGGKGGSEPGHIGWLSFDHCTARPTVEIARMDEKGQAYTELLTVRSAAGDPQLHTHVAVPNVVVTNGGRVGSMDLDRIQGRVHEFGAYYQAHVATNLRRHGVDVTLDERTGAARLTAIPERVRASFSKRTANGTDAAREYAAEQGLDWDALSPERKAGLVKEGTQTHKLAKAVGMSVPDRAAFENSARRDDLGDFAAWTRQAEALRWNHRGVVRQSTVTSATSREERMERAYQASLELLDPVLRRRARIDGQELRVLAARGLIASGVQGPEDIGAVTAAFARRGVRQDGRATALVWGDDVPLRGKARVGVTTALHEDQERELTALARKASLDRSSALSSEAIARAVAGREALPLDRGGLRFASAHGGAQLDAMAQLGRGGRFAVTIGVAGAGKSALLAPLIDAWRADGRSVYGAALAWRQADDLAKAGIAEHERASLAAFLRRAETGSITLDRSSVVVIDEVGLIGTREMLALLRLQDRHGFQLVAVGDPRQCQSIQAGPVIAILKSALPEGAIPEILTTLRQRSQQERDTSLLFREGRAAEALDVKRASGTAIAVPGGHKEAVDRVAKLWRERVTANADDPGFSITVSAPTNSDARALAGAIREQRRDMGSLGADEVTVEAQDQNGLRYEMTLARGDRVRLFAKTRASFGDGRAGNIGSNGSVLEVRGSDPRGLTLRTATGITGIVKWDTLRDPTTGRLRIAYGDVLSIDAIQGATSTEHINALPSGTKAVDSFRSYVAESRHRETTWLVTSDGAERREVAGRRPLDDPRPIRERDVWDNMARNLSRQPEKVSSLAFLERAKNVRRGTVGNLQAGLQPGEQRRHEGRVGPTAYQSSSGAAPANQAAAARHRSATVRRMRAMIRLAAVTPVLARAVANGMDRLRPSVERAVHAVRKLTDARQVPSDRSVQAAPRRRRRR